MKREKNFFDRITDTSNMLAAAMRALRGKKRRKTVASFFFDFEKEIFDLQEQLRNGTYQPRPYRMFTIYEPKERSICCSDFRDRVIHHAVCRVLEPAFERRYIHDSYACRVGKGAHVALRRTHGFTRKFRYYLKCDVRKYFESIDHAMLKELLGRLFKDERLMNLLSNIIDHQVPGSPLGKGMPIGNLTSQHFANLYLGELDHFIKDSLKAKAYLRYMDDFVVFSNSKEELQNILEKVRLFLKTELKLELKEKVVRIAPISEGLPFLGFRIFPKMMRMQRANLVRFRKKIRSYERAFDLGLIDEDELYRALQSMVAHAKHGNVTHLFRREFERSLKLA